MAKTIASIKTGGLLKQVKEFFTVKGTMALLFLLLLSSDYVRRIMMDGNS